MKTKRGNGIRRLIALAGALLLAAGIAVPRGASCDGQALKVSLPETVKGYTPCTIKIKSPCAGEAVLRLLDANDNQWLVMHTAVAAGENKVSWDGLGANLERMFAGPYHFDVTVTGEDGTEWTATAKFNINATTPTLVYALPSSETLYLDGGEKWFVEYYVSYECIVDMEVRNGNRTVWTGSKTVSNEDGETFIWNGTVRRGEKIAPGDYTVTFRGRRNPDYSFTYPLHVEETTPAAAIAETGPVVPERGMTDEQIWEIMMKPSVVIRTNGVMKRYDIYERPSTAAKVTGSLRGGTQALEVLEAGERWTLVRAWTHTNGTPCTGYIRTDQLQVVRPSTHYGLLIDKRDQTLTVYEDGKAIGTLPVSTGKTAPGNTYRETPAGAFLTNVRDLGASFAQEGFRYEYPIRYDAGNMIHGVGYTRSGRVRDYSANLPLLGQKASHGCIRVSSFVTEDCDINIYWLWTRLPYHTRVIILDDADGTEVIDDEDQ